jgi:glucosylglycerate phosphorylase
MKPLEKKLFDHLAFLYGEETANSVIDRFLDLLHTFQDTYPELREPIAGGKISEKDAILITYGDMVRKEGEAPLKTLSSFLNNHLDKTISTVHILPFYPYSSDDGFAVMDYRQVNKDFGTWEDVSELGENFRLMFDAVVNHISSQSAAFQGFLKGEPKYEDFFTVVDPETDLSKVFRPRAKPLLTPVETADGEKYVWTTFSADQIDLNFANPEVLLEVADILLFYAAHGAEFVRLDAVTFVWKEIGTTCVNLPGTHRIVQTMRTILDLAAPNVVLITETNVPHEDNIAYFGDGTNEAQMVYNFALPLLTLHAFLHADVRTLSEWAATLDLPSDQVTFFNFIACHDGIGMLPVKNILSLDDLSDLAAHTKELGGFVSYKSNEDGSQSPYELNINYLDALTSSEDFKRRIPDVNELNINYLDALRNPQSPMTNAELIAKRFLATQAIMLVLRGVPGIYFHSLFGSKNWTEGVEETGRHRTINREKVQLERIEAELNDPATVRYHVFEGYKKLLKARKSNPAFHPWGGQEVLDVHKSVFALLRSSLDGEIKTICLQNASAENIDLNIDLISLSMEDVNALTDLISQRLFAVSDGKLMLQMAPYEILWLS